MDILVYGASVMCRIALSGVVRAATRARNTPSALSAPRLRQTGAWDRAGAAADIAAAKAIQPDIAEEYAKYGLN